MENLLGKFSLRNVDKRLHSHTNDGELHGCPAYVAKFCLVKGASQLIAIGYENGFVGIEDTTPFEFSDPELQSIRVAEKGAIFDLDWSNKSPLIVTASSDATCRLLALRQSGVHLESQFSKHKKTVKCVKWMSDSDSIFASGGRDSIVCLWDRRLRKPVSAVIRYQEESQPGSASKRPKLRAKRTRERRSSGDDYAIQSIAFVDDVKMVTAADRDRSIKVWDLRRNYPESWTRPSLPLCSIPYSGQGVGAHSFVSLCMDPTSSTLYANCTDNVIYAYDAVNFNSKPVRKLVGHRSQFQFPMDISCDGSYLATASADSVTVVLWNLRSQSQNPTVTLSCDYDNITGVSCHAFDPGVLAVSGEQSHCLWRIDTWKQSKEDTFESAKETSPDEMKSTVRSHWDYIVNQREYGMGKKFRKIKQGQKSSLQCLKGLEEVDRGEDKENHPLKCLNRF